MCIYCDLGKDTNEGRNAKFHAESIIETCRKIEVGYRNVLTGSLKPHTDRMKDLVSTERHLIRLIIDDVL